MKKIIVIVLIIIVALLFFWFVPIIRITIDGSGGLDNSFQFVHYITLKDYLFSARSIW